MIPRCCQVVFALMCCRPLCTDTDNLENNILMSGINVLSGFLEVALLSWPRALGDPVQPRLALALRRPVLSATCCCSMVFLPLPHCSAPGEELPFHEGPCVSFITTFFVCATLPFVSLFCFCFSVTWLCWITVHPPVPLYSLVTLTGVTQSLTPHSILYFVCDFLKSFLSKVKRCRRDSGLISQSIYQERWRFYVCVFVSNFHIAFLK